MPLPVEVYQTIFETASVGLEVNEGVTARLTAANPAAAQPPSSPLVEVYQTIFETASEGLVVNDRVTGRVIAANPAAAAMHDYPLADFVGLPPAAYLHSTSLPFFLATFQTLQPGQRLDQLAVHLRRDQSEFQVETRRTALMHAGQPAVLSVLRDVSARVQAEQVLRWQVDTHAQEQVMLLEISQTLAATLALQPGLILDQLRLIIEYTHAALFTLDETDLVLAAARGWAALVPAVPVHLHRNGPAILRQLFPTHQPLRITTVNGTTPATQLLQSVLNPLAVPMLAEVQAWMWVPLAVKGRLIGCVGVAHRLPDYFTPHHANLALTVANLAAIALVNAELYEHAQALATLRERQRLAQELHDAVNQSLFSAGLIAEVLPRVWERDQAAGRQALEDLRRLTRGAQAEMRLLLVELRPAALLDSELGDLLYLLGNAFTGRAKLPVRVQVEGHGCLPPEVQVMFYRVCQEGLNNIAKHAAATQVTLRLHYGAALAAIELYLHDDGDGFDPAAVAGGHYGLRMMRERAEAVGAQLVVSSQPERGTTLTLRWASTLAEATP